MSVGIVHRLLQPRTLCCRLIIETFQYCNTTQKRRESYIRNLEIYQRQTKRTIRKSFCIYVDFIKWIFKLERLLRALFTVKHTFKDICISKP